MAGKGLPKGKDTKAKTGSKNAGAGIFPPKNGNHKDLGPKGGKTPGGSKNTKTGC